MAGQDAASHLDTERLSEMLAETALRLPGPARRAILEAPIATVAAVLEPSPSPSERDGAPLVFSLGIQGRIVMVFDLPRLGALPESVCRYLIAREFAHIALGHCRFLSSRRALEELYDPAQLDRIRAAFAEQADHLLIDVWGLGDEAREAAEVIGCDTQYLGAFVGEHGRGAAEKALAIWLPAAAEAVKRMQGRL